MTNMHKNKPMQRLANAKLHIKILVMEILRLLINRTKSLKEFPKTANTIAIQEHTRSTCEPSKSPQGLNTSSGNAAVQLTCCIRNRCLTSVSLLRSTHALGGNLKTLLSYEFETLFGFDVAAVPVVVEDVLPVVIRVGRLLGQVIPERLVTGEIGACVPTSGE